jgi:hypothetical protein
MSLTRVNLTQHPGLTQRDRARFQRDLDRSGLERNSEGHRLRPHRRTKLLPKESAGPAA